MESSQSVTCAIMLAAGSRYETPDTNGIAHFAEHMFFKGTERRPTARDISMEIDGIGGGVYTFPGDRFTGNNGQGSAGMPRTPPPSPLVTLRPLLITPH